MAQRLPRDGVDAPLQPTGFDLLVSGRSAVVWVAEQVAAANELEATIGGGTESLGIAQGEVGIGLGLVLSQIAGGATVVDQHRSCGCASRRQRTPAVE